MVENHVVENPDEILVEIGRQGFTAVTCSIHEFFIGIDFSRYVCALFDATASTPPQRAVALQLATSVYRKFLEQLVSVVKQQQQEETIDFDVDQMSGVGRSKVRHVGGWAVRKVLENTFKEMCLQSAVPLWPELKLRPGEHLLYGTREKESGITKFTHIEKSTGRNGGNGHG